MKASAYAVALLALFLTSRGAEPAAGIPLMPGLGAHTRTVSTDSPQAQRYFDQGLNLIFGFNHGAAIRSFQEAARLDPQCAMAHWGIALACGPHINLPMVPPPAAELAWKELALAQSSTHVSLVERALIDALATRYANPPPADRAPLDLAYANAMRGVWKKFPHDADVGAFFAESMMDLRPWDQWTTDGQPQPGTDEILATLDAVLQLDLQHPFANHLYIHAVEASKHPERAIPAADRLLTLQPALAHNVHMPSHIYIRVGRWQDAVDSNVKAVAADRVHRAAAGPPKGFLPVYVAHNHDMLAYAAMMTGQSKLSIQEMRDLVAGLSPEFMQDFGGIAEIWLSMPLEAMVRFGHWDDILAEPAHPASEPFTHAFQHAARAIAYAAKGDLTNAHKEQADYVEAAKAVPADEIAAGNNTCQAVIAIVTPMLAGEILVRDGHVDEGFAQLREAVKAEDSLHYDEPPSWIIPVRHSLGAALMANHRYAEAEAVYREDLERLPGNGWSLYGLSEALARQHKIGDSDLARADFQKAWRHADLTITSSCLCQP